MINNSGIATAAGLIQLAPPLILYLKVYVLAMVLVLYTFMVEAVILEKRLMLEEQVVINVEMGDHPLPVFELQFCFNLYSYSAFATRFAIAVNSPRLCIDFQFVFPSFRYCQVCSPCDPCT